ncbi:YVTN family beta-propeller protein [Mariniflexile fucanivorans]|uniref:YVTN family beta-propeller protein n=1 Tax=Mariniflexile fucanivorans TaxID=264023 RepID=A0A4R1RNX4_9FLAO|nr:YncE family protein [Mariniflexile fucanivorans]TCL67924.1 YVTN family beta-propeller protein [Mariniflexile fucanivorans]
MFKKRIKYLFLSFGVIFLLFRLSIYVFRLPSYTISTTGKLYVVNKGSRDVQVIDLSNGKEIAEIPIDMLSYEAITTADERRIVATNYESDGGFAVKILNTKNNEVEKTIGLEGYKVNGIIALPEANKVALVDYHNDDLLVLNVETDSIEKQISTKQKKSHLLVHHPNQAIVYVTNIDSGSISVIDLNLNKVIKIINCGLGRKGIAITPDGSELWVTNTKLNTISIINTNTYEVIETLNSGNEAIKLNFSIDGKYCFIVNSTEGVVSVFNQKSKKKIKTIHLHGKGSILERVLYHTPRPVNILMHPNGLYAFVTNSNANKIEVIDMKTLTLVSTIGTGKIPDGLAFVE